MSSNVFPYLVYVCCLGDQDKTIVVLQMANRVITPTAPEVVNSLRVFACFVFLALSLPLVCVEPLFFFS